MRSYRSICLGLLFLTFAVTALVLSVIGYPGRKDEHE